MRLPHRIKGLGAGFAISLMLLAQPATGQQPSGPEVPSTAGQLLVATPELRDPNFVRTVVYMVRHSPRGAMGFVVNRAIGDVAGADLARVLAITEPRVGGAIRIHAGGPVALRRAFVLHSRDYAVDGTVVVDADVAFTAQDDVTVAMFAAKAAPRRRLVVFGHAGWAPGQLDAEIEANAWIVVPAEPDIVFDDATETKWERALALYEVRL